MSKRNLTPGAPSLPPRPSSSGAPPLPSRPGRSGTGDAPPIPGRNGGPPPIPSPFGSNSTTPAAIVAAAGAPPPVPKKRSRRFPLLIPVETWTQNHDKYRSMAEGTNRATNVLLDDPAKYWVAPSGTNNWIIFDFGGEYNITGIRLETITNTMTPKNIEIQSAETFAGPYKTVMQFSVDNKGSSELTARGEFQEFTGFDIKTQFIKLILKNNYGGFHTMLKQLQFYGLEMKLESWLTEQGLQQYFINFLEADISQLSRLALMTEPEIKNIVQLAGHRKKLMMALREVKDQICLLSKLKFSIPPTHHSYDLAKLPAFEVHGDPGSEEPIAVFAHGGALIGGTAIKRLVPNGTGPSTAVFDDITLSPAGTYLLEIQAVNNPQVFCRQDKPIVVEFKLKDSGALNAVFDDLDNMLNFD